MLRICFLLFFIWSSTAQTDKIVQIDYLVKLKSNENMNAYLSKTRLYVDKDTYRYEFLEGLSEGSKISNVVSRSSNKPYNYHIGKIGSNVDFQLTNYPEDHVTVVDTIPNINWTILDEFKEIGDYTCTKAIGNYRGRVMHVYFSPEIPITIGPNNLNGLPGAILFAQSHDTHFTFEAVGIKRIHRPKDFIKYDDFDFAGLMPLKEYLVIYDKAIEQQVQVLKHRMQSQMVDAGANKNEANVIVSKPTRGLLELYYEWQLKD
jgi:GLPGLI family protein